MNRREFIKAGVATGLGLALPVVPAVLAQSTTGPTTPEAPQLNFGPDFTVTELYQEADVWYACLKRSDELTFWLKSYNGRRWGTLDWQPKRFARVRS